jgi:hypothetical protein
MILLLLLACTTAVHGYPSGPPSTVCDSMAPNVRAHRAIPQISPPPYKVTTNVPDGDANAGKTYIVSITSSPGTTFKGFMCQVRSIGNTSAIGSFKSFDIGKAKNLACTSGTGAVVHRNPNVVSSFNATWEAPYSAAGIAQLIAYCTIVQEMTVYWIQVPSSPFGLARYNWSVSRWSGCTAQCGLGIQRRTVTCHKTTFSSTTRVLSSECRDALGHRPFRSRDCRRVCQCVPSAWTPCNVSCGCGHQTRTFGCMQDTTSGGQVAVAFRHCENDPTLTCLLQERQQCKEPCYEWTAQSWGACSAVCGPGTEDREVYCTRQGCDGIERVEGTECIKKVATRPSKTRNCTGVCQCVASDWTPCNTSCGCGRQVQVADVDNKPGILAASKIQLVMVK